ncbi:MAG: hypothetical protein ABI977_14665 [Acidobacteriota bacterium]
MAYREFTLSSVEQKLGVTISQASLFSKAQPAWLQETLAKGRPGSMHSANGRCASVQSSIGASIGASIEQPDRSIFGCVTTGEDWQFLKLKETTIEVDADRYYIDNLEKILGAFKAAVDHFKV